MSYRKISVNGIEYEYVIGKSHIKIKGHGVYSVKAHGNPVAYPDHNGNPEKTKEYVATPKTVSAIILGKPTPVMLGESPNKTEYLMTNPFSAEIYGKTEYLPFNSELYDRLSDDI